MNNKRQIKKKINVKDVKDVKDVKNVKNVKDVVLTRGMRLRNLDDPYGAGGFLQKFSALINTLPKPIQSTYSINNISGDVSNDVCPLHLVENEVECWMAFRKNYKPDDCRTGPTCSTLGSCTATTYDDPWQWLKMAKTSACRARGGRVTEFDSDNCYLPCRSGYNTHDYTCTGWKSHCIYWDWFGGYWTGCVETYTRPKVRMFDSSQYNEIKSQPDRWRYCIF